MSATAVAYDPLLYGRHEATGLVALEHEQTRGEPDRVRLYFREDDNLREATEPFTPFFVAAADALKDCPVPHELTPLAGSHELDTRATFSNWKDYGEARRWITTSTGFSTSAPGAPFYMVSDPVQQYLMLSGHTLFKGLRFDQLARMQVDIECYTAEGFEFCNPEREEDRIVAIAVGCPDGTEQILSGADLDEKQLLEAFVKVVQDCDPDVLEGHNIFNFDLPYIAARAKRHRVKLALGRDGSTPRRRASRLNIAERTVSYDRFEIYGRHVIDTLHLVQAYDVSHRSLDSYGLKPVAIHFGLAAPDRTYIPGSEIGAAFMADPERVMRYVRDDILETRAVATLLSHSFFTQAQMLPLSYQNVCVRGNATKIDALLVRAYLWKNATLPCPGEARPFAGGYTDLFVEGVVKDVHHCDVRSLYPSLMLSRDLFPRTDNLGVFSRLLDTLRSYRLEAKARMQDSQGQADRNHFDALQGTYKILINSFYGYLGFQQGRFNDYDAAETITADGRALLKDMIDWLSAHGAQPIEIDTDGIYFVPPPGQSGKEQDTFRRAFMETLPEGIEIEFDGEYKAMYSYKMKNYALLMEDDEVVIKGAALKSRGLEPFQRDFLREIITLKLKDREPEILNLKTAYDASIRDREWPIQKLAKTETLQDAPATYQAKQAQGKGSKRASYELALASSRDYRAGDQLSYYVTGKTKSVSVHANSKLASEWDPEDRDENVAYYLAKVDALGKKFANLSPQTELAL